MTKILALIFTLCSLSTFAQIGTAQKVQPEITVGKVAPVGSFIAELTYSKNPADDKDTTYTLRFRNYKLRRINDFREISFSGIGGAVDQLYALLKSVFTEENRNNKDYAVDVTLGDKPIQIGTHKEMGTTMTRFITGENSYGILTEKQLDKLFGK